VKLSVELAKPVLLPHTPIVGLYHCAGRPLVGGKPKCGEALQDLVAHAHPGPVSACVRFALEPRDYDPGEYRLEAGTVATARVVSSGQEHVAEVSGIALGPRA
jgi:hypothetical protein